MRSRSIEVKEAVPKEIRNRSHSRLYKELEANNYRSLHLNTPEPETGENECISTIAVKNMRNWGFNINNKSKTKKLNHPESHYAVFQRALKVLLICGQCLGLNPILGILEKVETKTRFTIYSWIFLYSVLIGITQAGATILCFYRLFKSTVSITMLGFFNFYVSTFLNTIQFIRIAAKWPDLAREVAATALDEYIDPKIKFKCNLATAVMLTLAFSEHVLSVISRIAEASDCFPEEKDVYKVYIENAFSWFFEIGIPYYLPIGVALQFINILSTMNWNYSDLFIVCISFYLTSILERINTKIISARGKYLPSAFWRSLREDYNKATRLVRTFDDVISGIIFTSFATNLFFVCLQLFNVLANGVKHGLSVDQCPNFPSGPFGGYEHAVYFTFSLVFVLARSLAVSLIAAGVHSASLVPAPALYDVPSPVYCSEVHRFLEQIHGDTVALSGLNFFYVTKGLVLTVASTIVTYELVLLQFNGEDAINKT